MSIYGNEQLSVCCHVNNFTTATKIFTSSDCVHQPNLSFKALMILELFRIIRGGGGGEGRGKQRRGLRTKALMRDLGTRLECRQRVFVRTGKTL